MKNFLLAKQQQGIRRTEERELHIALKEGATPASSCAPERVEILAARFLDGQPPWFFFTFFTRIFPKAMRSLRGIKTGHKTLARNPGNPKTEASPTFISELTDFARLKGADLVGFCKVDPRFIFKHKGVLFENAVILAREMDKDRTASSPSPESFEMIMKTYADLGRTGNEVADFIRSNGFGAHASHSLGGVALYPVLAQAAGIGYIGSHGLLVTPEFGSRQRLSAVFTSIENLPEPADPNPHSWILDYCYTCDICIRVCPGGAIHRVPVENTNGTVTHIDNEKCFPSFYRQFGCSWCIKECPFSTTPYEELKQEFESTSDAFLKDLKKKRREKVLPGCVGTGRGL